jgi:hypothetical protein
MAVSIQKALAVFGAQSNEWKREIPAHLNSRDFRKVSNARWLYCFQEFPQDFSSSFRIRKVRQKHCPQPFGT